MWHAYIISAVVPEVMVTASRTIVTPGQKTVFTCSVIRANPTSYTYAWRHESGAALGRNSPTLSMSFSNRDETGMYTCAVTNEVGVGRNSITIECKFCSYLAYNSGNL